jgi:hypothetical protein
VTPRLAIDRLEELASRLGELPDAGGEAGEWFRAAVANYLAGARDGLRFDVALGLIPPVGGESWFSTKDREGRNRLLCEIAVRFFADKPIAEQAREIAKDSGRFKSGSAGRGNYRAAIAELLEFGPAPAASTIRHVLGRGREIPPIAG